MSCTKRSEVQNCIVVQLICSVRCTDFIMQKNLNTMVPNEECAMRRANPCAVPQCIFKKMEWRTKTYKKCKICKFEENFPYTKWKLEKMKVFKVLDSAKHVQLASSLWQKQPIWEVKFLFLDTHLFWLREAVLSG